MLLFEEELIEEIIFKRRYGMKRKYVSEREKARLEREKERKRQEDEDFKETKGMFIPEASSPVAIGKSKPKDNTEIPRFT